jgi:hypothetical protein
MSPQDTPRARMPRARVIVISIAAAALLLVLVSVLGSSPAACGSCHKPYAQALAETAHMGVACYDCHLDAGLASWTSFKTSELVVMYPAALIGRGVEGPGARVARDRCANCHAKVLTGILQAKGTRIRHDTCAKDQPCDQCHGVVAHGKATRFVRQPVMDDCVRCHLEQKATINCDACHIEKSSRERLAAGPWQVTHGKNWRKTHGMGDITVCNVCHPQSKCVSCHGTPIPHAEDFGRTHGASAMSPEQKCDGCHDRTAFCKGCHGIDMPHAAGTFLKEHGKIAKSRTDKACLKCHYQDDCDACHAKHTHPGNTKGTLKGKLPKATVPKP